MELSSTGVPVSVYACVSVCLCQCMPVSVYACVCAGMCANEQDRVCISCSTIKAHTKMAHAMMARAIKAHTKMAHAIKAHTKWPIL